MTIVSRGVVFHPLTRDVMDAHPDLDPVQHDARLVEEGTDDTGWADSEGRRSPTRFVRDVYQQRDEFYYWDDLEVAVPLLGSRGIAIVRNGRVIATFTTVTS